MSRKAKNEIERKLRFSIFFFFKDEISWENSSREDLDFFFIVIQIIFIVDFITIKPDKAISVRNQKKC